MGGARRILQCPSTFVWYGNSPAIPTFHAGHSEGKPLSGLY
jgi:hypothetical protein